MAPPPYSDLSGFFGPLEQFAQSVGNTEAGHFLRKANIYVVPPSPRGKTSTAGRHRGWFLNHRCFGKTQQQQKECLLFFLCVLLHVRGCLHYFSVRFVSLLCVCVCVCVFFPSILDIKFVGCTSRGHTGGRSHRIFNPPSFCGACLDFCREKDSAIPFPRRP